jgi:hypothetical protein
MLILFKQFYWLSCCHLTFRKFQTGSLHMTSTTKWREIKMVISLVKLSFLFNLEITVFHRYLLIGSCETH